MPGCAVISNVGQERTLKRSDGKATPLWPGAGIAQWLERRTRDRTEGPGSVESRQERRENFLLQGQLSVLTLIWVSVPPPCYRRST